MCALLCTRASTRSTLLKAAAPRLHYNPPGDLATQGPLACTRCVLLQGGSTTVDREMAACMEACAVAALPVVLLQGGSTTVDWEMEACAVAALPVVLLHSSTGGTLTYCAHGCTLAQQAAQRSRARTGSFVAFGDENSLLF